MQSTRFWQFLSQLEKTADAAVARNAMRKILAEWFSSVGRRMVGKSDEKHGQNCERHTSIESRHLFQKIEKSSKHRWRSQEVGENYKKSTKPTHTNFTYNSRCPSVDFFQRRLIVIKRFTRTFSTINRTISKSILIKNVQIIPLCDHTRDVLHMEYDIFNSWRSFWSNSTAERDAVTGNLDTSISSRHSDIV